MALTTAFKDWMDQLYKLERKGQDTGNGANHPGKTTAGKIGPPGITDKKRITGEKKVPAQKTDRTGGVARGMHCQPHMNFLLTG